MIQILCNFQYICSICTTKDSRFRKWWTLRVNTHYANEIHGKLTAHSWIFQGWWLMTKIRKRVENSKLQRYLIHRISFAYHMSNVICNPKWVVYLICTILWWHIIIFFFLKIQRNSNSLLLKLPASIL